MRATRYIAITLAALLVSVAAADDPAKPAADPAEMAAWVKQLSANRFAQRELATQNLIDAGQAAIEPVVQAVYGNEPEAVDRSLHVLRQLGLSDDEAVEDAARAALERLAASDDRRASLRAKNTMDYLNELRQDRAIAMLRKLGGTVDESTVNQFIGAWHITTRYHVTIDENWKGEVKGLKYIRWLPTLQMVTFRGKQVDDQWLESIAGLRNLDIIEINRTSVSDAGMGHVATVVGLETLLVKYSPVTDDSVKHFKQIPLGADLKLYGTEITPEGAEDIERIAGVTLDYRRGGFLGVGCTQTEAGCTISQIHPDSAAQAADVRVGDIITEYGGKPVPDFEALTKLIGENAAGDNVQVKLRRGEEELTKELTLGEWD